MKSLEHRAVGEAAAGGTLVELGDGSAEARLILSYGDVVALSGDYFTSHDLFQLAAIPGERGTKLATRDEIICALKVMAVDEDFVDARFEPGGEFSDFRFAATAGATEVERRVRDRFLTLAIANGDHFVAPDRSAIAHDRKGPPPGCFGSAVVAYHRLHEVALEEACRLGRCRGEESRAMAREAAAQHYLTDAFAAGHLRTPVTAIRRFWHHRYPQFWHSLQRKVAADTAAALRELTPPARILPDGFLYQRVLTAVHTRTSGYPPITLGDLLARVFHDWDDSHGLTLQGGGHLFGDGHLDQGVGRDLAIAAARAGINDIEIAYQLGASGSPLHGAALYRAVRSATGAPEDTFAAETRIPTPAPDNPPQNWQATDIETLWHSPIVGTTGTTVGKAVEETLRVGDEVARRLACLGPSVFEVPGFTSMAPVRRWVARKGCQAYHQGFIQGLAQDPRATVLAIVDEPDPWMGARRELGAAQRVIGRPAPLP
jgi:hypothetical protein